jgi:sugar phosphate isomerase/epimerase
MPSGEQVPPQDNQPAAARRSIEEIVALASDVSVRVAVEVIPNQLSSAAALVRLIEEDLDGVDVGVCLDYGHAHLMGDLGEAIETVSGHLLTTHVHDNVASATNTCCRLPETSTGTRRSSRPRRSAMTA